MYEIFWLWKKGYLPPGKMGKKMRLYAAGALLAITMIGGGFGGVLLAEHPTEVTGRSEDVPWSVVLPILIGMMGVGLASATVLESIDLRDLYRYVRGKLSLPLQNIPRYQQPQLESLARGCLCEIGSRLVAAEKRTRPYDWERIKIKAEFEEAHRKFQKFGLIGAAPFSEFIPQS